MSPVESLRMIYVTLNAGTWVCTAPDELPQSHDTKHDAVRCAILWAYANRPAQAVLQPNGVRHVLCSYDENGHAEVFEPLSA